MALLVHMENEYGLDASHCYIKIDKYTGDKAGIELDILIYATAAAKVENKRPLKRERITIPYPTTGITNLLEYCYSELKSLPQYTFAEDI